jgi:threonine dehydrogenase-like Zn-dependent dehydrogenase
VKALVWEGVNELGVEQVPEPKMVDRQDAIIKVRRSATCGSDLHLIGGYIPFMRPGDVLGHEFLGEVVEVGEDVRAHKVGDRVVVSPSIACGRCWFCANELYSACDNGNTNPAITEALWGQAPTGIFGYSHAMGGFAGSHAEYVRVPYADRGAFTVPDGVSDERALFAADSAPTGWMGADLGGVRAGDVVAVWGAGAVGQLAARAAMLLGAERVIVIDRFDYRLRMTERHIGAETLNYQHTEVGEELLERTGGRGADVCIEAVGMEAHGTGPQMLYDTVKQQLRLETDRQGWQRVHPRGVRRAGGQVPARCGDEQGPDRPVGAGARPAIHPDAARTDAARRAGDRAPRHPRAAAGPGTARVRAVPEEARRVRTVGVRAGVGEGCVSSTQVTHSRGSQRVRQVADLPLFA